MMENDALFQENFPFS